MSACMTHAAVTDHPSFSYRCCVWISVCMESGILCLTDVSGMLAVVIIVADVAV